MNIVNMNRETGDPGRKLRLEDQVQRLTTYNTMLRETLQELYEWQGVTSPYSHSDAYELCLKKCKKVLS